jgi:hypothetical protein
MWLRFGTFIALLGVVALVILSDLVVFEPPRVAIPLDGALTQTQEKAVDILLELTALLVTLALGILGALSFFIRERAPVAGWHAYSVALIVVCGLAALLSIYFGHLVFSLLVEMLTHDMLQIMTPSLVWSVRLQYLCILLSAVALLFFVFEMSLAPP